MAYYETIKVVAGDSKPDLEFTLRDAHKAAYGKTLDEDEPSTWAPLDLSSSTVEVKFRALGGTSILDTMTCGLLDQTSKPGQCFMQWNADTLDVEAGTYEAEITVTDTTGSQTAVDKFKIKVRSSF
jgi:hypothetical protein